MADIVDDDSFVTSLHREFYIAQPYATTDRPAVTTTHMPQPTACWKRRAAATHPDVFYPPWRTKRQRTRTPECGRRRPIGDRNGDCAGSGCAETVRGSCGFWSPGSHFSFWSSCRGLCDRGI